MQWSAALRDGGRLSLVVLSVAGLVLAVLAGRLFRRLPGLGRLDRRQAAALALTGGALLLLGALLGSMNAQTQEIAALGRWGAGWRDSPLTVTGGMLAVGGLLAFAGRVAVWRGALAVLVLAGAGSASASHAFVRRFDR